MNSWLYHKYINILSTRFKNFKRKSQNLYNFSCPFCSEIERHPYTGKGYIYEKKGSLSYFCHSCNASYSIDNFIKNVDHLLYEEYVMEKLKENKSPKQTDLEEFVNKMKKPKFLKQGPLKGLKKISQLSPDSRVKQYIVNRKIPNEYHSKLFCCPNFMNWVNGIVPGKFDDKSLLHDETRVLIPFVNKEDELHGFQGRSINPTSKVKYITIILDDDVPKIYGLDTVDTNKQIIGLEGPLDSVFIKNAVASAGGDLLSTFKSLPKDRLTICLDNEPRHKETIKKMEKTIRNGYSICIWPSNFEYKDINEAVQNGIEPSYIEGIIKTNTYKELNAQLELSKWRKI